MHLVLLVMSHETNRPQHLGRRNKGGPKRGRERNTKRRIGGLRKPGEFQGGVTGGVLSLAEILSRHISFWGSLGACNGVVVGWQAKRTWGAVLLEERDAYLGDHGQRSHMGGHGDSEGGLGACWTRTAGFG